MRILIVGWGIEPEISGGMDIHASRVAENLASLGHEVHFFVPGFNARNIHSGKVALHNFRNAEASNNPEAGEPIGVSESKEMQLHFRKVDIGEMPSDLQGMISSIKAYSRGIFSSAKKMDFDVIHTHDWIGAEVGMKMKDFRNAETPSVSEESKHRGVSESKEMQLHFRKHGKKWIHTVHSLEHMRSGVPQSARHPINRIEKTAIGSADVLLTVSRLMQKEIFEMYDRVAEVVYNAPSVSEVPVSKGREDNRIFFAGRLAEQKGLKYLIYAMRIVAKEHSDAKLVIAGTGHLREPLEEFSKSLGLEDNIQFLGFVSREKLIGEYQKATLFVSPSIFEPFGITLLDAAVLGAPIVATENTGALELFEKDSIAVVKPEDSQALAEKIIALLMDKGQRDAMVERAKNDAGKVKGWKEIAGEVEGLVLK